MNPRPTFFTTGKYNSRRELKMAIRMRVDQDYNWEEIGRQTGVSARTAKRVWQEDEAIRKEARAAAYDRATGGTNSGGAATAKSPPNFYLVVAVLIAIAIAIAFTR